MIIHALVIAPYKGLIELTSSLKEQLNDFRITMLQGDLSEVLPMLNQIEQDQYDVIISRGGTAKLLRQHVTVPVIDIQVSGYDMMRILALIKDTSAKVEMIGFPNIIEGFISVSSIMNIEIPYTVIEHEDDAGRALSLAKQSGVSTVLGDTVTVRKAQEYGLEGVLITSGKESVLEAFAQAKYMQVIAERYKQKCSFYEQLLDKLDTGFVLFDERNRLQYSNDAFFAHWGITRGKLLTGEQPEQSSVLARLLDSLKQGAAFDQTVIEGEQSQLVRINAGPYPAGAANGLFYIQTDVAFPKEIELTVSFSVDGELRGYPFLVPQGVAAAGNAGEAEEAGNIDRYENGQPSFPVALYGERGAGKRLWTLMRAGNNSPNGSMAVIGIALQNTGAQSLQSLQSLLQHLGGTDVLYLSGIETVKVDLQKQLAAWIAASLTQVLLSFEQSPADLHKNGCLETGLFELIKGNVFSFPPLRERRGELEGWIRSFIAKANETTGKQVAGIRPVVLEGLLNRPWPGNFIELKETIDLLVQHAEGEFIDESAMKRLESGNAHHANHTGMPGKNRGINLNQTLEEIERDIIAAVMEEEQFNQSNAAKRLGINRSTLWRKLKQNEH